MKEEHISKESLVDMFASFDNECRRGILQNLEKSIKATEEDIQGGVVDACDILIKRSFDNLVVMRQCCLQAQEEFDELSQKKAKSK